MSMSMTNRKEVTSSRVLAIDVILHYALICSAKDIFNSLGVIDACKFEVG